MSDGLREMRLMFCADPLDRQRGDPVYEPEAAATRAQGVAYDPLDFEALLDDCNAVRAMRQVSVQPQPVRVVYRG